MLFKDSFAQNPAMRFVYEHLQFSSSMGRDELLNRPFMTNSAEIEAEYDSLEAIVQLVKCSENTKTIAHLCQQLHQVNDIRPTLALLAGGTVLDDIQLFEIKKSALLNSAVAKDLALLHCTLFSFDEPEPVIALLDPEHTRIPHFYIYSAYDEQLSALRMQVQVVKSTNEAEAIKMQIEKIEDGIRARLSDRLRAFQPSLGKNIQLLARLDVLLAKAKMAVNMQACRPQIGTFTNFQKLVNPQIAEALAIKGRQFQPIDLRFDRETVLITGANMAGKTVLLKTVALAQYMFQFAFYVPAQAAVMVTVDEILCSIENRSSETGGLSSFAVEILTIDHIIKEAKAGKNILALVDEPARTTNPEEGKRLVNGFLKMMNKLRVTALITTHYSGISALCRRLRVKGLKLDAHSRIAAGTIADYMDYGLVETDRDKVPREAFVIAKLLQVDDEFLQICQS